MICVVKFLCEGRVIEHNAYVIWFGKTYVTVRTETGHYRYKQTALIAIEYRWPLCGCTRSARLRQAELT